jgi:uncharacterized protein YbbC (DUF1343 family)
VDNFERGNYPTALSLPGADRSIRVLNGIDVLREQAFAPLSDKRVGLITNHTGQAVDGASTIDLFFKAKACRLVALFSPEHGIRGNVDASVDSAVDAVTGLPIHSLYGNTRRPTTEMLRNVDALVFDIRILGRVFILILQPWHIAWKLRLKPEFLLCAGPANPIEVFRLKVRCSMRTKPLYRIYAPSYALWDDRGQLARYFNTENHIGAKLEVIAT